METKRKLTLRTRGYLSKKRHPEMPVSENKKRLLTEEDYKTLGIKYK